MSEPRKFPAQKSRVETGPVQFGDDWPGVFIRGDRAIDSAVWLRMLIRDLQNGEDVNDALYLPPLQSLMELLRAANLAEQEGQG